MINEDKLAVSPRSKFGQNQKSGRCPGSFRFAFSPSWTIQSTQDNASVSRTGNTRVVDGAFLVLLYLSLSGFFSVAFHARGEKREKPYSGKLAYLLSRERWIDFTGWDIFWIPKIRNIGKNWIIYWIKCCYRHAVYIFESFFFIQIFVQGKLRFQK